MAWVYVPKSSDTSACFLEGEDSKLPSASPSLTPDVVATSKKTPSRKKSSKRGSKTGALTTPPSGTASKPLTETLGVERFIASLEASHARTSVIAETEKGSQAKSQVSGESMFGSFAKYDRASSSWKTSQHSLFGGLVAFSETWPSSGMMRNGECSARKRSAPPSYGNDSSSWPTPTATQDGKSPEAYLAEKLLRVGPGRTTITNLNVRVKTWPTPRVSSANGPSKKEMEEGNPKVRLETEAALWPTPVASASANHAPSHGTTHGRLLAGEACEMLFPTPTAQRATGYMSGSKSDTWRPTLDSFVQGRQPELTPRMAAAAQTLLFTWTTPTVHGNDNRKGVSATSNDGLATQVATVTETSPSSPPSPPTATGGETSSPDTQSSHPQLNPRFVEHLQGWPINWTQLTPLAPNNSASLVMASYLQRQVLHLECLLRERGLI